MPSHYPGSRLITKNDIGLFLAIRNHPGTRPDCSTAEATHLSEVADTLYGSPHRLTGSHETSNDPGSHTGTPRDCVTARYLVAALAAHRR